MKPELVKQFFVAMIPPTVTHHDKELHAYMKYGKPRAVIHDSENLRDAKAKIRAHLTPHRPEAPIDGAIRIMVKWMFPVGSHVPKTYKTTKPDTDNLQKVLKDSMTQLGFWHDDAQVASEIVEKFWSEPAGIFIRIEKI